MWPAGTLHILSWHSRNTPDTCGIQQIHTGKEANNPKFAFIWDHQVFKGDYLASGNRPTGEISVTSHRLFSILSIGEMMGWKIFYRQHASKGLNLCSVQSPHRLEETELSVSQSTACLCLDSWIKVHVHGGKPQIMTNNNTCERLDVHLHCEGL